MTLARQEHPDLSAYDDPEVVFRAPEKNHAGVIVRSDKRERVEALVAQYSERFRQDFFASLPAADKPTH